MKFFTFSQNNSGGVFADPAQHVIVQADCHNDANNIAQDHGLYFNGCHSNIDCDCCGDRWYSCDDSDGDDSPAIYGQSVDSYKPSYRSSDDTKLAVVIYKNGDVRNFA